MGEASGKFKVEKPISYSDHLVGVLKDKKDLNNLAQCLQHCKALRSSSDADFNQVQNLLRDYEKKVDACKQKTEAAKFEVVSDEELDLLQRELDGNVGLEMINNEINDLERQRVAHQEKRRIWERREENEFRKLRKLSMYASVTYVIAKGLEDQSCVLGSIVDRDKKTYQKVEFDPTKMTALETCNSIWKIIS